MWAGPSTLCWVMFKQQEKIPTCYTHQIERQLANNKETIKPRNCFKNNFKREIPTKKSRR